MGYVANTSTKEVHKKPTLEQCNVDDVRTAGHAKEFDGDDEFLDLMRSGYSPCEHCMKEASAAAEAAQEQAHDDT